MQLRTKRYLLPSLIAAVSVTQFMIVATDGALGVKGSWHIKAPGTFSGTNRYHHFSNKAKMLDISVNRDVAKKLRIRGGGANEQEKGMSSSASIFNLVNNMAGAGILTLSSGVARGTGSIPAIVICSVLGFLSAHCVSMVGESCELTGESDFKGLWGRTMGEKSTYVVDSMIAILCLSCAVVYSGILGDVFTPLLRQAGFPDHLNGRTSNIIVITLFFLLPLSLIKDLSALAFTSILGSAAVLYSVLFIIWRSLDGSYRLPYGNFLEDGLIIPPSFKRKSLWNVDFTSLVLASNFGLAYVAHYNAPIFYRSLRNTNARRFRSMVDKSFFILVCLYSATMMAGYVTFGDVCQGNILLNYHPNDVLATLGRIATGFSILFGFPLVLCGSRESIVGLASSFGYSALGADENNFYLVSAMLIFVTVISCCVQDVSFVVGLTGAALGSTIAYICPPLIYTRAVAMVHGANSEASRKSKQNLAFVPFGVALGIFGCVMTVKEANL